MTSLTESLKNNPIPVLPGIGRAVMTIGLLTLACENETTKYDLGVAVENLLDALEPSITELPDTFRGEARPETDDTRPLYQRIDDEVFEVGDQIRRSLDTLQLAMPAIADDEVRENYWNVYVAFAGELGLPMAGEYDPADHPSVGKSPLETLGLVEVVLVDDDEAAA